MSFKLHYDRERNDELCLDPEKYYSKFEGVNYHDTIMVTRKEVYFNPHKQPRTENQNIGNVEKLSTSIITKNYDHKYRPQSQILKKKMVCLMELLVGIEMQFIIH